MRFFFILLGAAFPALLYAAIPEGEGGVQLLVKDLPFIGNSTDLASYLQNLFKLTLGVAVTAAIVILVLNGIRYMTTDIVESKADAKKWIYDVLWGLLLAFASVLILQTINPQLTRFDFISSLQEAAPHPPPPPPGGDGDGDGDGDGGGIPNEEEESALRAELALHNITASRPCEEGEVTQDGCVTLFGLPQGAIQRLIALAEEECDCALRVTGGVEPGHSTHGPGSPMVDLSRGGPLTNLIQNEGVFVRDTCLGPLYKYSGSEFLDEQGGGPHWHACLGTTCGFQPGC